MYLKIYWVLMLLDWLMFAVSCTGMVDINWTCYALVINVVWLPLVARTSLNTWTVSLYCFPIFVYSDSFHPNWFRYCSSSFKAALLTFWPIFFLSLRKAGYHDTDCWCAVCHFHYSYSELLFLVLTLFIIVLAENNMYFVMCIYYCTRTTITHVSMCSVLLW